MRCEQLDAAKLFRAKLLGIATDGNAIAWLDDFFSSKLPWGIFGMASACLAWPTARERAICKRRGWQSISSQLNKNCWIWIWMWRMPSSLLLSLYPCNELTKYERKTAKRPTLELLKVSEWIALVMAPEALVGQGPGRNERTRASCARGGRCV